jgi:hypothetical protein
VAVYATSYAATSGAATFAANFNFSSVWTAIYNLVDNSSGIFNPNANYSQLNITSTALGGFQTAIYGFSNRGAISGNPGYSIAVRGTSNSQNEDALAVMGSTFSNSSTNAGGYFEANNYTGTNLAYAYVGASISSTARKIVGTGTVREIVPTPNHGRVTLTCPESPEYWYQDYGTVKLVNGKAHVDLDPILADIIIVNSENPIRVFCTPVDMLQFNGVAVVNRTSTGFDLVEMNGGTHSGILDYQLVMKPKTNYGEGRFPQAPGPAWLKADTEPASAKAKNQPQANKIFHWPADWEVYGYDVEKLMTPGSKVPTGPNKGKFKVAEGVFMDQMPVTKPDEK